MARRGCTDQIQTTKALKWNLRGKFKLLGIKYDLQKHNFFEENIAEKVTAIKKLLNDCFLEIYRFLGNLRS